MTISTPATCCSCGATTWRKCTRCCFPASSTAGTRGEKVTIIDLGTRRTRTSEFADHYLEFRPQTDLAIANCIAQQLIERGAWDKKFVENHCAFRADADIAKPDLLGVADHLRRVQETHRRIHAGTRQQALRTLAWSS